MIFRKLFTLVLLLVAFTNYAFTQSYPSSSGNGDEPDITNVSFGGISQTSSNTSYADYTGGSSASIQEFSSYTLSVTTSKERRTYVTAWIDWNDDGDFTDSGEEYIVADRVNSTGPHTVSITVPSIPDDVEVRMRITSKKNSAPSSTESGFDGEVEDYLINAENVIPPVDTDIFYYVADGDNDLYTINKTTGVTTNIGSTNVTGIEAIANWPAYGGQVLYACNTGDFGTINTTTGAYTSIGEVDGGGTATGGDGAQSLNDVDGLAFDPRTGILWASNRRVGDYDLLFQIDPATGLFVPDIFGAGIDYIEIAGSGVYQTFDDIAISPDDGTIYGVSNDGTNDQILSIEVPTGNVTVISSLASISDVEGLGFSSDNKMYGVEGIGDEFAEIIWTTGASTTVNASVPGGDVESLAALVEYANRIEGRVYHDDNQNLTDDSESGLSGVTVEIYYDNNGDGLYDAGDEFLNSVVTDANGDYSFDFAYTGDLVLRVDVSTLPSGYSLTTDNIEEASFASFGNLSSGKDFGADSGSDCDGDGIPDFTEGAIDSDSDGVDNMCDLDSDNDGILDSEEGTGDKDGDGIPNYLDLDSDNDGIPDAIEANGGTAPTGYVSSTGRISGSDTDADGLLNSVDNDPSVQYGVSSTSTLPRGDHDGDGIKDFQDKDSDNDGIMDAIEAGGTDANGDGIIDAFSDSNSDGYSDALTSSPLSIPNTDASWESTYGLTSLPNYLDLDSDNDAIDDGKEGYSTAAYQTPSILTDSDGDGVLDLYDSNSGGAAIIPNNHDGDAEPDYIDLDSDDDGIDDNIEGNDDNNDNVPDQAWSNTDANGNGIDDAFDNNCSGVTTIVVGANDHGEENQSTLVANLGSSDLELFNDGTTHQKIGLQFSAVNVPQGETILEASIQFEVDEVSTGTITATIHGEDIDNAPSFTTTVNNISGRTLTSASTTWSPADWNTVGENGADQNTGDIKTIVQEIVNRGGWSSGNSMVFVFSGANDSSRKRTAETNPTLTIKIEGGLMYACGTDIALQDIDEDTEHDFRDDIDDSSPLPIELLDFEVKQVDENVQVTWTTASEINNDYFIVERSENGVDFEPIHFQNGAGNSNQVLNYEFIDQQALSGVSYYRLKQVDYNGDFTYSEIKQVEFIQELELKVFPNPSNGVVNIEVQQHGLLSLYSVSGQLVMQVENYESVLRLDLAHLPKGVYSMVYASDDQIVNKKLILR
jgi:hypothetical protein